LSVQFLSAERKWCEMQICHLYNYARLTMVLSGRFYQMRQGSVGRFGFGRLRS